MDDDGSGDPLVTDPLEDGSAGHPFDAIQEGMEAAVWAMRTAADPNITVAAIDTGVDYNHVDLADNIWKNSLEQSANGLEGSACG